MSDSEGRKLSDLRVIDLRTELERRNLDKNGVKAMLLERLEKALKDEGEDPDAFLFEVLATDKKSPLKRPSTGGNNAEVERGEDEELVEGEEVSVEDMVVKDEVEGEAEGEEPHAKRVRLEGNHDVNGLDNNDIGDSINLDIGEDELLNEEGDGKTKQCKDDTEVADNTEAGGQQGEEESTAGAPAETGGDEELPQDSADRGQHIEGQAEGDSQHPDNDNSNADAQGSTTSGTAGADKETDDKDGKKNSSSSSGRNLWVSGLSGDTRAKDLKQLCSKYGKVVGAKVVTNTRTPGSRCYGYVTMVSSQEADNCIKHLHRTELHGRMISVEKAKSELGSGGWVPGCSSSGRGRSTRGRSRDEEDKDKKEGEESKDKDGTKSESGKDGEKVDKDAEQSKSKTDDKKRVRERGTRRDRSPKRGTSVREVLSFSKIRREREVQRERERMRRARSEERRRRVAEQVLRDQERRHRIEKQKLALEREKLRIERERIEREKHELHRIERERQKLEREKLEFERLELKRAQMKLEEERRAKRGGGGGYPYSGNSPVWSKPSSNAYDSRGPPAKRSAFSSSTGAPPAPPHFSSDAPSSSTAAGPGTDKRGDRDRERRDYPRHPTSGGGGSSSLKFTSNGSSYESRQPLDQRYEGTSRSDRYGGATANHQSATTTDSSRRSPKSISRDHRYPVASTASKDYDRSGGSGWNSSASSKGGFPSAPPSWNKPGETWSTGGVGGSERYSSSGGYAGDSSRYPLHQPAPPGSQTAGSFPDTRYTSQRDYRKY